MTAAVSVDYFGVKSCGCVTAWASGKHSTPREVRDFYRSMADTGREVRLGNLKDMQPDTCTCEPSSDPA